MPRVCGICSHKNRLSIDRGIVAGKTLSGIARKYDVSHESLRYHRDNHLSRQLLKAQETRELLHSKSLLEQITGLLEKSKEIMEEAERKGHLATALRGVAETRSTIELLCKLATYLHEEEKEQQPEHYDWSRLNVKELEMLRQLLAKLEGKDVDNVIDVKPIEQEKVEVEQNSSKRKFKRRTSSPRQEQEESDPDPEETDIDQIREKYVHPQMSYK